MSRFMNKKYAELEPYTPGEQPQDMKYIKLNTNESPYPPSPAVLEALSREEAEKLRLYCDPDCKRLKEKLAETYGVRSENVFVSNGSDDILNFAFMAFGERGAAFPDISYGFYKVFAALNGVESDVKPLRDDFTIDISAYFDAGKLVVTANPNAPTGIALGLAEIEELIRRNAGSVVLVDEAYVDFGAESAVTLTKKYENLLVVQTFSKSRQLAGARLGFAIAQKELIADLETIKYSTNPYNVNRLTQLAGVAALSDAGYFREKCAEIRDTRAYATAELKKRGFEVLPSEANFIFAKSGAIGGERLYRELKARGILVRHFTSERISEYNRITIGTRAEIDALLSATDDVLREERGLR